MISVKCYASSPTLMPKFATPGSVACDLHAAESVIIPPGERRAVSTGIRLVFPSGYCADVKPRSGRSISGVDCILGTIDTDYRGVVKAIMANNNRYEVVLIKGERIAQLEVRRCLNFELVEATEADIDSALTVRGANGFGSTGNDSIMPKNAGGL